MDSGLTDALLARYDVRGPRYTSYPTVPAWAGDVDSGSYGAALRGAGKRLSLYVHVPFCEAMCSYCGCNVVVTSSRQRADRYLDVLEAELDLVIDRLGEGDRRQLASIHWGGGTPTFLTEGQLTRLWGLIVDRFDVEDDAEIAVEIDPMATTDRQLRLLSELGFNRLSMGVQDLDERVQVAIGRGQSAARTREVLDRARALGFSGVNFDLIYGLPEQNKASWARTVERLLEMAPDRLALYSFAYLPDQRPHQRRLSQAWLPVGREKLDLFLTARSALLAAGWVQIGLDHFARPGDELARARLDGRLGRNFQGYTVRAAPETVAVGASAISDVGGMFAQNLRPLARYAAEVRAGRLPIAKGHTLTADDRRRRAVVTDLMCNGAVQLSLEDASAHFGEALRRLAPLAEDDLVTLTTDSGGVAIDVTELGQHFLRNVAMAFDAYLPEDGSASAGFSRTV